MRVKFAPGLGIRRKVKYNNKLINYMNLFFVFETESCYVAQANLVFAM